MSFGTEFLEPGLDSSYPPDQQADFRLEGEMLPLEPICLSAGVFRPFWISSWRLISRSRRGEEPMIATPAGDKQAQVLRTNPPGSAAAGTLDFDLLAL
jgi:hypothetical protein